MAIRGCSIGALPRRTKLIVGVGLAVAAAGLGYVVYRATKKNGQGQQATSMMPGVATTEWQTPIITRPGIIAEQQAMNW